MTEPPINRTLLPLLRPIETLREDPENARDHDERNILAISESLRYSESAGDLPSTLSAAAAEKAREAGFPDAPVILAARDYSRFHT